MPDNFRGYGDVLGINKLTEHTTFNIETIATIIDTGKDLNQRHETSKIFLMEI